MVKFLSEFMGHYDVYSSLDEQDLVAIDDETGIVYQCFVTRWPWIASWPVEVSDMLSEGFLET